MAIEERARPLDTGAAFPQFVWDTVDGGTVTVPVRDRWTVVVIYRGDF